MFKLEIYNKLYKFKVIIRNRICYNNTYLSQNLQQYKKLY